MPRLQRGRFVAATLVALALVGVTVLASPLPCALFNAPACAESPAAYSWKPVPLGAGGYVTGLIIHPTSTATKYIRTDVGGAFRWEGGSGTWTPITDKLIQEERGCMSIESIAVSERNADELYIATNDTVYKSVNRGNTWTKTAASATTLGNDPWRNAGERLAVDPKSGNILYFGTRKNGLHRSTDGGTSWETVPASKVPFGTEGIGVTFVVFDKNAGVTASGACRTIFVGIANNGVYRTTDGGATWAQIENIGTFADADFVPQRAALNEAGDLYVSYARRTPTATDWGNPGGGAVRKYARATNALADVTPKDDKGKPITGIGYGGVTTRGDGSLVMVSESRFSSDCAMYRSTNGGASWSRIQPKRELGAAWWPSYIFATGPAALVIDPEQPRKTWMTDGIGVWGTDDNDRNDQQWKARSVGIEELCVSHIQYAPKKGKASAGPLQIGVFDFMGFDHSGNPNELPKAKWDGDRFGNTTSFDFCEANPDIQYRIAASDSDGGRYAYYTEDRGEKWIPFPTLPPSQGLGGARIAVSAGSPDHLVWLGGGMTKPYFSLDRGKTWRESANFPPGKILWFRDFHTSLVSLASDRVQAGTFYLYANNGDTYRSTDTGNTWTLVSSQTLPWWYKHSVKAAPHKVGDVWISFTGIVGNGAERNGLYRSSDGGATWSKINGFSDAVSFSFGAAKPGKTNTSTVYVYGVRNGVRGVYRSDDVCEQTGTASAATWTQINADYPLPPPAWNGLAADREFYGVLYLGADGRGAFVGKPKP